MPIHDREGFGPKSVTLVGHTYIRGVSNANAYGVIMMMRKTLKSMMEHELDEWFMYKGKHMVQPHNEEFAL